MAVFLMNIKNKIFFVFFLSGVCGLIYQVLWVRMLGLIFGNTTYAVSTILAGFMAGLALGSWWFGKRIDVIWKKKNNLKIFGYLMLGIGIYCAFTPFLFNLIRQVYILFGITEITAGSTLLIFILGFIVILIPTALMGGTLPVLTKWLEQESKIKRPTKVGASKSKIGYSVGILYSVNTWGAVLGAFLTGYVLIMVFGVKGSLYLAVGINLALAGVVFLLAHGMSLRAPDFLSGARQSRKNEIASAVPRNDKGNNMILVAVALSGFTALAYQVVWVRILSMVLGSSVYAYTTMLGAFLTGLALGSAIYAKFSKNFQLSTFNFQLSSFGFIQAGIGISVLLLIPIFGILPVIFLNLFKVSGSNFAGFQFIQFLMVFGVMLIPTTLFGATLPLACRIYSERKTEGSRQKAVGSSVGNVYAADTTGAIIGSITAGFLLMPLIGFQKTMTMVAMVNVGLAIILFNFGLKDRKWQRGIVTCFLLFFTIPYAMAIPEWNKKIITSGIYKYAPDYLIESSYNPDKKSEIWKNKMRRKEILFYEEGTHFTVTVQKQLNEGIMALLIDGKADASSDLSGDMITQTLSGHLPIMLANNPEKVLVVGLASGVTLGAVTKWNGVKEINCIEIEPAMVEASRYFNEWSDSPLDDERVSLIINDARNYLLTTDKKYDIIISAPSNPWISGSSSLFTREYYTLAKSKLKKGGIFCGWMQLYNTTPEDYTIIINTIRSVFPHISLWSGASGDTLILATPEQLSIDFKSFDKAFENIRPDMEKININVPLEMLSKFIMIPDFEETKFNTDNRPIIEFSAGRNLYNASLYEKTRAMLSKHRESISHYLKNFDNYYQLARIYLENNIYSLAEVEFEKAIDKSSNKKESYTFLGYIKIVRGELEKAKEILNKALKIDSGYTNAYINLSQAYLREGYFVEASDVLKKAINMALPSAVVHNNLGDIYRKQGYYDIAIQHFNKAIQINRKFAPSHIHLGVIYLDRKKNPDKAEAELLKAVEINPHSANAYYQLGRTYLIQNRIADAQEVFNRAMQIDSTYVSILMEKFK